MSEQQHSLTALLTDTPASLAPSNAKLIRRIRLSRPQMYYGTFWKFVTGNEFLEKGVKKEDQIARYSVVDYYGDVKTATQTTLPLIMYDDLPSDHKIPGLPDEHTLDLILCWISRAAIKYALPSDMVPPELPDVGITIHYTPEFYISIEMLAYLRMGYFGDCKKLWCQTKLVLADLTKPTEPTLNFDYYDPGHDYYNDHKTSWFCSL
jgi:hypothetical protein